MHGLHTDLWGKDVQFSSLRQRWEVSVKKKIVRKKFLAAEKAAVMLENFRN